MVTITNTVDLDALGDDGKLSLEKIQELLIPGNFDELLFEDLRTRTKKGTLIGAVKMKVIKGNLHFIYCWSYEFLQKEGKMILVDICNFINDTFEYEAKLQMNRELY